MSEYNEDEIDEYLEEEGYLPLTPITIRTGLVVIGGLCMAIGIGYLSGPGMGWLFIGLVSIMAAVFGRGE